MDALAEDGARVDRDRGPGTAEGLLGLGGAIPSLTRRDWRASRTASSRSTSRFAKEAVASSLAKARRVACCAVEFRSMAMAVSVPATRMPAGQHRARALEAS